MEKEIAYPYVIEYLGFGGPAQFGYQTVEQAFNVAANLTVHTQSLVVSILFKGDVFALMYGSAAAL